jgi:hypothetical protein
MGERVQVASRILSTLPYTSLIGLAGLVATIALGFEEAHTGALVVSAVLLASAPAGMSLHLANTTELTAGEKRLWLRALAGRGGLRIAPAYFRAADRRRATGMLSKAVVEQR